MACFTELVQHVGTGSLSQEMFVQCLKLQNSGDS